MGVSIRTLKGPSVNFREKVTDSQFENLHPQVHEWTFTHLQVYDIRTVGFSVRGCNVSTLPAYALFYT